ncbi:carboxylic ester hydrolase [Procambarus clarkii]|uniref:carboxylic ester hydrolase n=1 Tax=Procambarus clarkii TaxID=6728 RepID=UPI001E672166|nr:venom carboxylesterase-6-like [Procambarus clarkii]
MMRLAAVAAVMAVVAASVAAEEAPEVVASEVVVETQEGLVSGLLEESTKGKLFHSYLGIPFAKPPVGSLRFKDPVPGERWEGVLEGTTMPTICPQLDMMAVMTSEMPESGGIVGDEDCLYLNVFTPKPGEPEAGLPVMVFIHGGGFFGGGAQDQLPHVLLNRQVVLVIIQYRLGMLGFLSTEDSVIPGNFGLKDQTLALQWVQRNIHNFGGDKTKVTIFGVSAGGASVHYQLLTPKSEGLFARAIMQSGAAVCPWALSRSHADVTRKVAQATGCSIHQDSQDLLKCLQGVDAFALTALSKDTLDWFMLPFRLGPRVDGDYLPAEPAVLLKEGRFHKVPLVSGIAAHEGVVFTLPMYVMEHLRLALENDFEVAGPASVQSIDDTDDPVGLALKLYRYYVGEVKVTSGRKGDLIEMMSDRHFTMCHDWASQHHAKHQGPDSRTFRYELTHNAELSVSALFGASPDSRWVSHGDDIFYLFRLGTMLEMVSQAFNGQTDLRRKDDLQLREIILSLWLNFAATGNPTPDDSLGFTWEPSTEDNLQYLNLTPSPSMEADQRHHMRMFHASLPTKVNLALHPHLVKQDTPEADDAVEDAAREGGSSRISQDEL